MGKSDGVEESLPVTQVAVAKARPMPGRPVLRLPDLDVAKDGSRSLESTASECSTNDSKAKPKDKLKGTAPIAKVESSAKAPLAPPLKLQPGNSVWGTIAKIAALKRKVEKKKKKVAGKSDTPKVERVKPSFQVCRYCKKPFDLSHLAAHENEVHRAQREAVASKVDSDVSVSVTKAAQAKSKNGPGHMVERKRVYVPIFQGGRPRG